MPESQPAGGTVYLPFVTPSIGAVPSSLSGGVAEVYKNGGTTQSTAGVTLTADFDAIVGQNLVAIDTSADGAFYTNGGQFWVKVTGTVAAASFMEAIPFSLAPAIRDVRLANGVAHGGTPGTSTATFAVQSVNITCPEGDALQIMAADGTGLRVVSDTGYAATFTASVASAIRLVGGSSGGSGLLAIGGEGGSAIRLQGSTNSALYIVGGSSNPTVYIESQDGPGIEIATGDNHGISILAAGANKKAILLGGDTASDALAISVSYSSSLIDVFDAAAHVGISLTEQLSAARALDAIADTSLTVNDALHCAIAMRAGKATQTGTAYVVKTPFTGTVIRTFTLDSATAPASRS